MSLLKLSLVGLAAAATASAFALDTTTPPHCRVLPGDAAWPSASVWNSLNKTVGGRLIASVPLASVCHDVPFHNFNADSCADAQATWNKTKLSHIDQPAEFFNMHFKNFTCDQFTPRSRPCDLGNYVSYVINVTEASDIQAGISFARKYNIRLVIKNTGHDYLGKSTGKGGLSLWTHNLKSTTFIPSYSSPSYKGPAIKLGAGIQGFEAYAAANATGHQIVGGTCPTVGIAGGYSQGGGHSMLSSSYGLAADNVLEWEVVTIDGRHIVATPTQNADLYWAMSGGGGGDYAIALSMTSRLHQGTIIGGATLIFNDTSVGNAAYWEAVGAFHTLLPDFLDAGNSATYLLASNEFIGSGITMPGADLAKVNALMKPFLDDLTKRGIPFVFLPHVSANFFDHFAFYAGPLPEGFDDYTPFTSNRIIPRKLLLDPKQNPVVMDALRNVSLAPGWEPLACQALNVSHQAHPSNAALPAWRDALTYCLTLGLWDITATPTEMQARQDFAVNVLQPMVEAATPGGGVYLNEANYQQHNFQQEFYGVNYPRLLQIKNKYDPESLLYAHTAVGSEAWFEDANNRLCRAK